jgi:hypothetical protein
MTTPFELADESPDIVDEDFRRLMSDAGLNSSRPRGMKAAVELFLRTCEGWSVLAHFRLGAGLLWIQRVTANGVWRSGIRLPQGILRAPFPPDELPLSTSRYCREQSRHIDTILSQALQRPVLDSVRCREEDSRGGFLERAIYHGFAAVRSATIIYGLMRSADRYSMHVCFGCDEFRTLKGILRERTSTIFLRNARKMDVHRHEVFGVCVVNYALMKEESDDLRAFLERTRCGLILFGVRRDECVGPRVLIDRPVSLRICSEVGIVFANPSRD